MNTHINKNRKPETFQRQYLGVTLTSENYGEILEKEGRSGINKHTKHLRAYLKGNTRYTHGFQTFKDSKVKVPIWHRVEQKLTELSNDAVAQLVE